MAARYNVTKDSGQFLYHIKRERQKIKFNLYRFSSLAESVGNMLKRGYV
jgi:hypothetical protein